jgi:hypothetical protein
MDMPYINKDHVAWLIQCAEYKVSRFEEKIRRLEMYIEGLKSDRDSATILTEHFGLSKAREKILLDCFVFHGEYGQAENVPEWIIQNLEDHAKRMNSSIVLYERFKERRLEGLKFLNEDIARLKKILDIQFQHKYFFLAVIDA